MASFCGSRVAAAVCLVCMMGCIGSNRQLKITEVSTDKIELYLNESSGSRMTLEDHELLVTAATATSSGPTTRMSLGALSGSLQGGQFLVIWEEAGYRDVPVSAEYAGGPTGRVPGIKVPQDFFASLRNAVAVEVRVSGRHDRGMVYDRSDDCVRYGDPTTRPATGGSFYDTSPPTLRQTPRSSGISIHRRWDFTTGEPVDEDGEGDWLLAPTSWGARPQ